MGPAEKLTQQAAAFNTEGCEVNIVKPVLWHRAGGVNISSVRAPLTGVYSRGVVVLKPHKLPRNSWGGSPETMCVAPTGVPDLGASSQAGCRLSLLVWKKAPTASSLWFPCGGSYFLVFSVVYIRGLVASSSMALLKGVKVSLLVEKTLSAVDFFFPVWETMALWETVVITGWSERVLCLLTLPATSRVTQLSTTKQRLLTVDAGNDSAGVRAAPQRLLVEDTSQSCKCTPTYKTR